jgi:tRNA 2-thiouridine synthesizing protein A
MGKVVVDSKGLVCPLPILMMTSKLKKSEVRPGDVMEVLSTCKTFDEDVRNWCAQFKKVLIFLREEGNGVKRCQIQI